jgi:hypothetical protein
MKVVWSLQNLLLREYLRIELIDRQLLHKINSESKGMVIFDLLVRHFLPSERFDFQTKFDLLQRVQVVLIQLAVNILRDEYRIVLSLLETRVDLESRYFYNSFSVQFDNALVRPSNFVVVSGADLETAHLYLIFGALLAALVFVGFQVAADLEFVVVEVGDVVLCDHLFDLVKGVDKSHPAVVTFNRFLTLIFLQGFTKTLVVIGPITNRAQELLWIFLQSFAGAITKKRIRFRRNRFCWLAKNSRAFDHRRWFSDNEGRSLDL